MTAFLSRLLSPSELPSAAIFSTSSSTHPYTYAHKTLSMDRYGFARLAQCVQIHCAPSGQPLSYYARRCLDFIQFNSIQFSFILVLLVAVVFLPKPEPKPKPKPSHFNPMQPSPSAASASPQSDQRRVPSRSFSSAASSSGFRARAEILSANLHQPAIHANSSFAVVVRFRLQTSLASACRPPI